MTLLRPRKANSGVPGRPFNCNRYPVPRTRWRIALSGPASFNRTLPIICERRSRVTVSIRPPLFVAQQGPSVRDISIQRFADDPGDGNLLLARDHFKLSISLDRQRYRRPNGFAVDLGGCTFGFHCLWTLTAHLKARCFTVQRGAAERNSCLGLPDRRSCGARGRTS